MRHAEPSSSAGRAACGRSPSATARSGATRRRSEAVVFDLPWSLQPLHVFERRLEYEQVSDPSELTLDLDRLSDERQKGPIDRMALPIGEQQLARRSRWVSTDEDRRDPAADAELRAGAVRALVTGPHAAEVTLGILDLAAQPDFAERLRGSAGEKCALTVALLAVGRQRLFCQLDHPLAVAFEALPSHAHAATRQLTVARREPELARSHEQRAAYTAGHARVERPQHSCRFGREHTERAVALREAEFGRSR